MAENNGQFSMEAMMEMARSPAGQQLLALLQQSGGDDFRKAAGRAAAGDLDGAKALLSPILSDPRIQALLGQMGGK